MEGEIICSLKKKVDLLCERVSGVSIVYNHGVRPQISSYFIDFLGGMGQSNLGFVVGDFGE